MNNLLERYAKLTSQVQTTGDNSFEIIVSNDEDSVMWLLGYVKYEYKDPSSDSGEKTPIIVVQVVDFDDDVFLHSLRMYKIPVPSSYLRPF